MTTSNEFELIYCDDVLLAANKPAGMLAVPGRGTDKQDCLSSRIQQEFPDALIVHRLDMATSGLIVFARGATMQRKLSCMFQERMVHKKYVAIVSGMMEQSGEINRPKQKVDRVQGKHSLTRYRLIHYDVSTDSSRVELEPVTGRTHQLRVHLAAIAHPIVGDQLYDGRSADRLFLHAASLNFVHPASTESMELSSVVPF
jgi:tRNA pseudouridine32 synthase / 23S rRNA pseudouridine746 synthase